MKKFAKNLITNEIKPPITPKNEPPITQKVPFYLLADADNNPLLIHNPKHLAKDDVDIAQQLGLLYLLPYSHQYQQNYQATDYPAELADQDCRKMVYQDKVFWTRSHALAYQKLNTILNFAYEREDSAKPIADKLKITRLMRQCQVGDDTTMADPAIAHLAIDARFAQFCQDYNNVLDNLHIPVQKHESVATRWQQCQQQHAYSIRAAFVKQYPEVLNLYLKLWEHGIILVEQSDVDTMLAHPINEKYTPTLPDTEITLALIYNAADSDLPEVWFDEFCKQLHKQLTAANCVKGMPLKQKCLRVGELPIPYYNLDPGTKFTLPDKKSGKLELIDFKDSELSSNLYQKNDLMRLHMLIFDCEMETQSSILSVPNSPVKSNTPILGPMRINNNAANNNELNNNEIETPQWLTKNKTATAMTAPQPAVTIASNSPALTQTPNSVTAKRLQSLLKSATLNRGSKLARTPLPKNKVNLSDSSNSNNNSNNSTPSPSLTKIQQQSNHTSLKSAASPSLNTPTSNRRYQFTPIINSEEKQNTQSNQSSGGYSDFITPYPLRIKRYMHTDELLTPTSNNKNQQRELSQIFTEQPIQVANHLHQKQHYIKVLFTTTSIASLFKQRLIHRYGLAEENVQLENNALYDEDIDGEICFNFTVAIKVPDRLSFWSLLEHAECCPYLYPHFGQAHLDLISQLAAITPHLSNNAPPEDPLQQFFTHLIDYHPDKGDLNTYISQHANVTEAYKAAAAKPFYPVLSLGLDSEEQFDMCDITYQYASASNKPNSNTIATTKRMQQWFDDLIKDTGSFIEDKQHPQAITRTKSIQQLPTEPQFNPHIMIDYMRKTQIELTHEEIEKEQKTITIHTWHGGAHDSLLIWAMEHGYEYQIQNEKRDVFLNSLIKDKINSRAQQAKAKINDKDIGHWFFVSSTTRQLIDLQSNIYASSQPKQQYALPSICLQDYEKLYLNDQMNNANQKPTLFQQKKKNISEEYISDSQSRYDTLIQAINEHNHHALIVSLEDIDTNEDAYYTDICKIKAQCFAQALLENKHQLQLIFFPAPVINGNSTYRDALQQAFSPHLNNPRLPKIVIANVEANAGYNIVNRFCYELSSTPLATAIRDSESPCPIAEIVHSPNYPLAMQIGLDKHNKDKPPIDSSLLDSTRLLSQHPVINAQFDQDEHYVTIKLNKAKDKKFELV